MIVSSGGMSSLSVSRKVRHMVSTITCEH
jgi:hypothetical protein